ncbi:trypsin-like serine protease [Aurantimonas aggregata]|uniref:Trypsin-like serine protease n=1 Tax=Aurantimonas aggregata TaxID=2047720 RepID=A0A6L9MET3_9HYPH|nr:serine protease [Aurantimonas aggregata]NDV86206.1 trypsin-like serine protease [Aurantimonas aggregata]
MWRGAQILIAATALAVTPVMAQAPAAQPSELALAYNAQTDAAFRKGLQTRLAWTGDYVGAFDGDIGAASLRAIRDFQARHGMIATGIIDEPMLKLLVDLSDRAQSGVGATLVDDAATGARMLLPLSLAQDRGETEVGNVWRSADDSIEIETIRIADTGQTLSGLFEVLSEPTDSRTVADSVFGGEWFVVRGKEAGRSYYMRFAARGGDLRGFSVSYEADEADRVAPYVVVASNLFDPFAGEPQAPLVAANEPNAFSSLLARKREQGLGSSADARYAMASIDPTQPNLFEVPGDMVPNEAPAFDMAGSGFIVSRDGWLLTNAHVVNACTRVLVGKGDVVSQTIIDPENDLALIKVDRALGEPLEISAEKPRLGEDILALGFPLRSILADSLNVTRGNVSSLLGLMNDERYLQISAPVQPGNSGGPLIDLAGRVVGVVTAKLNAVAVADATGDIPQSINFAIRPGAATAFLSENGIAFAHADASEPLASVPDATAEVKDSIFPVICVGG